MARNGSGTYVLPAGQPVVTGTTISSTTFNTLTSDIATALTQSLSSDGQTTPTANLPMGGYKHTNLGAGSALTDSANLGQVQSSASQWLSGVSGTDTITAGISPTPAAYAAGQTFRFVSAGANTGAVTINISSLGAKSVTKNGSTALVAGDIPSGAVVEVVYDGTRFQLLNVNKGGTGANNFVQLDASAKLPAVDGSQLTNLPSSGVQIFDVDASVAANALTVTINAQSIAFRSTTLTDGTPVIRTVSSPITMTVSSGSTLGTVNATAARLAVLAIDNAGTVEAAIVNIAGGTNLDETTLISTTAEGGAGAADSASVVYSTTARTNVAFRVVGFIDITEATAGTWASAPTKVQGAGGQALAMAGIGFGQTEQTVTRTSGTTYYNTSGRPIWLNRDVAASSSAATVSSSISINGGTAFNFIYSPVAGTNGHATGAVMTRPGCSYVITDTNAFSVTTTIIG